MRNYAMPSNSDPHPEYSTGILASQTIKNMIASGKIISEADILEKQIQPASIDLRLSGVAYRVQASFLPGQNATVQEKLKTMEMHQIDLSNGAVLEKGCVYIAQICEKLNLKDNLSATSNPKSSTGRLDIFTRLISDYAVEFETVPRGYSGPLYIEISPRTFSILARSGSKLNQIRFRNGNEVLDDNDLSLIHI